MKLPLGLHLGERLTLAETFDVADFADESGFDSLWVAEGRLTRDAIVLMSLLASRTRSVRVASGVVNNRSRNAALTAVTFKTLAEIAPSRICLGLGAWWEPLASKVGLPLRKPLTAMREYVFAVRELFAGHTVDFQGEFVKMNGVRFDSMYRDNEAVDIPIYIGAVGPKMLELAGEIADGVYLDFLLPVSYLEKALPTIELGRARSKTGRFEVVQIVSCSIDDQDPRAAIDECKAFLTMYVMQQPHIAEHCGLDPQIVERVRSVASWPATPADVRRAMPLIPDKIVREVSACGSSQQVFEMIERWHAAGVEVAVISPLGNKPDVVRRLAAIAR